MMDKISLSHIRLQHAVYWKRPEPGDGREVANQVVWPSQCLSSRLGHPYSQAKGFPMHEITETSSPRFRLSKLFWIGIGVFVVGVGPLLLVILLASLGIGDPNPNPIGPGILAFFAFWPSIGLVAAGLIVSIVRYCSARKDFEKNEA